MTTKQIERIYKTGTVTGRSGKVHKLLAEIAPQEGQFLFDLIRNDPKIIKTLEVGCANGLASLHICSALQERSGAAHTIIDPFQTTQWDGAGMRNLEEAGIHFHTLIESKSEFALPRLLEEKEGGFDFIFVDGWHTFDHTLLDCFYASRLLRVGGVLAIDDANFPSVSRVIRFLKNYPCYEECGQVSEKRPGSWKRTAARNLTSPISPKTWAKILAPSLWQRIFADQTMSLVALKKTREDNRSWDWHADEF